MDLKKKISEYFHGEGFKKKFIVMLLGVVLMGVFLSFLINVSLGTDPCTFMNLTISRRLGILFGTWQVILNSILFIFVILFDRHQIGPGTVANMVLIGYISDFCRWIWGKMNYPHRLHVGKGFCYAAWRHELAGCSMHPAEQGMFTMPLSHWLTFGNTFLKMFAAPFMSAFVIVPS